MFKPVQLPSGNWRVQVYLGKTPEGKKITKSVTAETKKEAERQAALLVLDAEEEAKAPVLFSAAADAYIAARRGVLSPNTVSEYKRMIRSDLKDIKDTPVLKLNSKRVQELVSDLALKRSPKTISNIYGFVSAVLSEAAPNVRLRVRLPQRKPVEISIPDQEDVQRMIDHSDGPLRAAIILASSMGLRRAEICALTWIDVKNKTLRIGRAYAKDEYNCWVIKSPKSAAGNRRLSIPPAAVQVLTRPDQAEEGDPIVPLTPDALTRRFERLCSALGMHYRFHALRHYYASVLLSLGVPDKYAMQRMGHSTPTMLKQVYQHLMQDKTTSVDDQLNAYFK